MVVGCPEEGDIVYVMLSGICGDDKKTSQHVQDLPHSRNPVVVERPSWTGGKQTSREVSLYKA